MKYDYNDNELIYMVRENDEEALDLLMRKYEPLMKNIAFSCCKSHNNMNIDFDDLVQELRLTLIRCIKSYKDEYEVKFFSYLWICLRKGSFNYFVRSSYYSDKIYEILIEDNNDFDIYLDNVNYVYNLLDDYEFENKLILFKNSLEFFDSCVFELRFSYFSYSDIAFLLGVSNKKIDNTLIKIRNKLREFLLT